MPLEARTCRNWAAIAATPLEWVWGKWWFLAATWYMCAIFTTAALKYASKMEMATMITMFANLVIGWPLVAPFAIWQGLKPIRSHWRQVLFVSLLAGVEKNLTNASLYGIGASLKTALHTFNVIFTFLLGALLGVDDASRSCILGCRCRGDLKLAMALSLVAGGGIVTAVFERGGDSWNASAIGIALQLGSSLAYALKYVAIKSLLGDAAKEDLYLTSSSKPPSTMQVAFVTNPVIGLVSLAFLPLVEKSWDMPRGLWGTAVAVAVSVTAILLFQLRLTKLTSALTVAVLGVLKDVVTVIFFLHFGGEVFSRAQVWGYAVSALGVVTYFCSLRGRPGIMRQDSTSSLGSAVEQCPASPTSSAASAGPRQSG